MAKAKPRKQREQNAGAIISGGDLDTSMFWFGDLNAFGTFPSAPTVYQKPRAEVFYMTRNWYERQVFIKAITLLKFDIYNYGFKLAAAPPTDTSKTGMKEWNKGNEKVQKWHTDNALAVSKFVRDAWLEWFIQDNCVALWMKNAPPVLFPIEHLTYQDDFGIECLSFAHGLSPEKIDQLPGVSLASKQALKVGKDLTLQKSGKAVSNGPFNFETLKRTRIGAGLAWPQLRTLFNSVSTWEGLELADWQLADALRTVYELHLIGHEIKNGGRAGMPDHFLKAKRAAAINKIIKTDKRTLAAIKRLVVNFDHTIEYPRPDPKHFSQDRYDAVLQRFMYWAMPIADMLYAKQVNPWHGNFLKAKANTERNTYMGPFINEVLVSAMGAPKGIRSVWDDDIFSDPRLMLDTLKTGLASGPISQQTFLEKTNLSNPHTEHARKDAEHSLPKHITHPAFDAAHGEESGRPPGSGDKQKRTGKSK